MACAALTTYWLVEHRSVFCCWDWVARQHRCSVSEDTRATMPGSTPPHLLQLPDAREVENRLVMLLHFDRCGPPAAAIAAAATAAVVALCL